MASRYLHEALEVIPVSFSKDEEAHTLHALAAVEVELERAEVARSYYEKALIIFEECGDEFGAATVTANIALLELVQGRYPAARFHYMKALAVATKFGNLNFKQYILNGLGGIEFYLGNLEAAQPYYDEAYKIAEAASDVPMMAEVLAFRAEVMTA